MKNWIKVLLAVLLVVTCMFSYAACNNNSDDKNAGNDQATDQTPDKDNGGDNTGSGGNSNVPVTPEEPEEPIDGYKINFYYSYTAEVKNEHDRTQIKNERALVKSITVPYENTGWSDSLIEAMEALSYNGYKFAAWYPEWDEETQTGWDRKSKPQKAVGDPFAFEGDILDDINLYGFKGDIAGENIKWDIVYNYQTDAAIVEAEDRTEGTKLVTFVTLSKTSNIVTKVALSAVEVGAEGWTEELLAAKDALTFDGRGFTGWYADWDMNAMAAAGEAYAFTEAPAEDLVLYGVLNTEGEADDETTQKSKVSVVLNLKGSGKMFDFANRSEVDVPWFAYREDITDVVMDDRIEYIGVNAFAQLNSLKNIHFSDALTEIGNYAFYETKSSNFKMLRLPENIKVIGANAFANTMLRQVILNEGLTTISERAFYGSNKVKYIVVSSTLTNVANGAFHPGASGTQNASHALAKVYYKGSKAEFTEKVKVAIDNEWFNEIPSIYSYVEKNEDTVVALDSLAWYFVENNGEKFPAQYSYAIKYKITGNLKPIAEDYVPILPKIDPETGEQEIGDDGPVFEGKITQANIDFQSKLMHEDGYGFVAFVAAGASIEVGTALDDDKDVTCQRATEKDGVREGVLGGGVKWKLVTATGALTVYVDEEYTGEDKGIMWDVKSASATGSVWYGSLKRVSDVKSLVIEDGVKHIGSYVFSATGISDVVIPMSVTSIDSSAFSNCANLYSVYYAGENFDAFNYDSGEVDKDNNPVIKNYIDELRLVYAKVFAKANAATADAGAYWYALQSDKSLVETAKVAWSLVYTGEGEAKKGALYVGGDITMTDFALPSDAPWYPAKDSITSLTVAANITSLAANMVSGYDGITSIKLNNKIKYVPETALEGTGLLNAINNYKNGLLIIDGILIKVDPTRRNNELFDTSVTYLDDGGKKVDISNIAEGALSRCDAVKSIFVSNTIKYINSGAYDDSDVERIYVNNTKTSWSNTAADLECSDVQLFYSGDYAIREGVIVAKRCNHVYGDWVLTVAPTCQTTGESERTCIFGELCEGLLETAGTRVEKRTENIDPNAHNYQNPVVVAPTCLADGYTLYTCCVEYVDGEDEEGNPIIKTCGATNKVVDEGSQLDHETVWGEPVVTPATCTSNEIKTYKCTCQYEVEVDGETVTLTCGAEKVEETEDSMLDHAWGEYVFDDNASEGYLGTETAKCTTCPEGEEATDTRAVVASTDAE